MAAGSTYTPIATTTLGSAQSSYTFSSIPSTYTDLVLIINGTAASGTGVYCRFNGDSGSNYSDTYITGNGSSATSGRTTNLTAGTIGSLFTSNATLIANFQNYSNTTTYKTFLAKRADASTAVEQRVTMWRNTSAISSMQLITDSPNFSVGTTFTLYGITAA